MDVEDDASVKKKIDNPAVSEKVEAKKCENNEVEDPKPRIVLTFRSEKSNTKSTNMKIVSSEEKLEEVSPRRSSRTRGKWDWVCDSDNSVSPNKDKSQPVSENDESDNSHTPPKRTRRRSKDDNVMANAIARKEKSYNEATPGPTQRLSRRIKPTAKILANEELRMGLESQNNARLGNQAETLEEGVRTRRTATALIPDIRFSYLFSKRRIGKPKSVKGSAERLEVVEIDTDSQNSDMKLEHLCKLGLKAIEPDEAEDSESKEIDENDADMLEEEDEEEVDDDSEVISKLLEADEDSGSDDDYLCSLDASSKRRDGRPRRSTRLYSSYGNNDSDESSPMLDEESSSKAPARRSTRRPAPHSHDDSDRGHRSKRKKRPSIEDEEMDQEEESNPAGGEEGSEAACPTEQTTIVATCFCEAASNVHASMDELTEPVFCQSIEIVDGVRVGCSHAARKRDDGTLEALVRAGPRAPYFLACLLHARQLANHMCCPACGLFCTQGIFYQCSKGHLFHLDCGIPHQESKAKPGCPHCGVYSYRWQPANADVAKVKLEMKCSNKRIFLPDQREQCTPAYLSFTSVPLESDPSPVIPEDLLPSARELKLLCTKPATAGKASAHALADAIVAGETIELLIPKIVSGPSINKSLKSHGEGTCLHVAAKCGHLGALYLLHNAGANLDATDANMRTPLMTAVVALLDEPEKNKDVKDDKEVDTKEQDSDSQKNEKEGDDKIKEGPKDEDLLKVIRYLVAAGCDVNFPDQPESMTPLHIAAHHGSVEVTAALLNAPDVNIDARDQGGWTPLVWAAENGHERAVRLLVEQGADPASTDTDGNSVIHWCVLAGCSGVLQVLLHAAPHLTAQTNAHADTPLHVAARQGHYACVVILLARGAKSDVENAAGELPMDVCAEQSQIQSAISLNMQMSLALKGKMPPYKMLSRDISNGCEHFPIPCVNEVDDEPAPTDFTYVTHHVTPEPVHVDTSLKSLQGCSCIGACNSASCACAVLSVRDWWRNGRLLPSFPYRDPPMLFHCGPTCACNKKCCSNNVITRLLERGAQFTRSEVYRVGGSRGWGLRAAAAVPRGTPVGVYCGELLALHTADSRPDDSYMFALDVKRDLLEQCTDKTILCVDARRFGSAARFINHSCEPNLVPARAFTAARDLRLPHVTLVATRDIQAGEPFTFDYGDKFWSVKSKWMKCDCASTECRYPTKAEDAEPTDHLQNHQT